MSGKKYHLTGSTKFFNDAKTYYNVPAVKVLTGAKYMCENFKLDRIFVYLKEKDVKIGQNLYIGCYSLQFDNFRTSNGQLHQTFDFR